METSETRALLVDDTRFDAHTPPGHHPERPERRVAARAGVRGAGARLDRVESRPATDDELARVHSARFIEALRASAGESGYLDPDTYVSSGSVDAGSVSRQGRSSRWSTPSSTAP